MRRARHGGCKGATHPLLALHARPVTPLGGDPAVRRQQPPCGWHPCAGARAHATPASPVLGPASAVAACTSATACAGPAPAASPLYPPVVQSGPVTLPVVARHELQPQPAKLELAREQAHLRVRGHHQHLLHHPGQGAVVLKGLDLHGEVARGREVRAWGAGRTWVVWRRPPPTQPLQQAAAHRDAAPGPVLPWPRCRDAQGKLAQPACAWGTRS